MRKGEIIAICVAFTVALSNAQQMKKFPDSGNYEYVGCFNDKLERAIPYFYQIGSNIEDCRKTAEDNGYDIFGLQGSGYCFVGPKESPYDKYGAGTTN